MSAVLARINTFRSAAVSCFKVAMPELRSCEEQFGRFNLEDLERTTITVPSLRMAVLDVSMATTAGGTQDAELRCAAFVITEGKARDKQAWAIAEIVSVMLHTSQRFGLTALKAPETIKIQPVISGGLKSKAVSVIAVEWKQTLLALGTSVFDGQGVAIRDVYVNDEELEPADGSE